MATNISALKTEIFLGHQIYFHNDYVVKPDAPSHQLS